MSIWYLLAIIFATAFVVLLIVAAYLYVHWDLSSLNRILKGKQFRESADQYSAALRERSADLYAMETSNMGTVPQQLPSPVAPSPSAPTPQQSTPVVSASPEPDLVVTESSPVVPEQSVPEKEDVKPRIDPSTDPHPITASLNLAQRRGRHRAPDPEDVSEAPTGYLSSPGAFPAEPTVESEAETGYLNVPVACDPFVAVHLVKETKSW